MDSLTHPLHIFLKRGEIDDATAIINSILEQHEYQPESLHIKALIDLERKAYDDALDAITDCLNHGGFRNPSHWRTRGDIEKAKGANEEALKSYRRALEIKPDDTELNELVKELEQ